MNTGIEFSSLKDVSGDKRYPLPSKLAKAITVIPHGNADVESMFSHIGLKKTKLHSRLSMKHCQHYSVFNSTWAKLFDTYKNYDRKMQKCNCISCYYVHLTVCLNVV